MDKDFMLNYYDKMVRPIWTEHHVLYQQIKKED